MLLKILWSPPLTFLPPSAFSKTDSEMVSPDGKTWRTWCQSGSLFPHLMTLVFLEEFLHLPLHHCKPWWWHSKHLVLGIMEISTWHYQDKLPTLWLDFHYKEVNWLCRFHGETLILLFQLHLLLLDLDILG